MSAPRLAARSFSRPLAMLVTLGAIGATARPAAAQSLTGTWDVVKVAVDRKDQPHWLYFPDDPRLLGRELAIGDGALTFNDGSNPCRQPQWARQVVRMSTLIATSFPRERGARATLADFGVPGSGASPVTVNRVQCAPSSDGREPQPWSEAWFVQTSADRLSMRIGTSALLILARRSKAASPAPSFSCAHAATDVEKLLCRSVPLAALDRSVAAAFRRRQRIGDPAALKTEQTEWLRKRDACGTNETCLADAMRARIDDLMQQ